jgi:hypothetical protein
MGAGCSKFGGGEEMIYQICSKTPPPPPNQGVTVVEFGISVLPLDLVITVLVIGERWLHLDLHVVFLLHVGDHHMMALDCLMTLG